METATMSLTTVLLEQQKKRKKIFLAAVDESKESIHALSWFVNNTLPPPVSDDDHSFTLVLLYVKPPAPLYFTPDGYMFLPEVMATVNQYKNDVAQCVMENAKRVCKEAVNGKVKVETMIERGDARDVICEVVGKLCIDLLYDALVTVMDMSFLAAVDESKESLHALSWFLNNTLPPASFDHPLTLGLLFVKPSAPLYFTPDERGDARDIICEVAGKLCVDLLVMGSHGYGSIKRAFLGSIVATFVLIKLCLLTNTAAVNANSKTTGESYTFYSAIENSGSHIFPGKETTANLATLLASSFDGNGVHSNDDSLPSFDAVMTNVSPKLFLAMSTIPNLSQATFVTRDGLLLSFYKRDDGTFAVYSNTSFSSVWYTQPVNPFTGELYGVALESSSTLTSNSSWLRDGLETNDVVSSVGASWNREEQQESLFLSTVSVRGKGMVSLGYPTKVVGDHFNALNNQRLHLGMATVDGGQMVLPPRFVKIVNYTGGVLTVRNVGGGRKSVNLTCDAAGSARRSPPEKVAGTLGRFYCSTLKIGGVDLVYIVEYHGLILMNYQKSVILAVVLYGLLVLSFTTLLWKKKESTQREQHLCASLIKQTEATQQAERKSMNKTRIFAGITHDVRNAIAQLVALIESRKDHDAGGGGELQKMELCAYDALGILDSMLDINKLESGKLMLKNEDFDLAKLIEELVDRFYVLGSKKGVDVVFDPSHAFMIKSRHVRGDQTRLMQILSNLLSNAIKFTSEGHVTVRAMVKKRNLSKDIIAYNMRFTWWRRLWNLCDKRNGDSDLLEGVEENPDEVEFEFEVDDTGKGIPKDEQKSVFEDYVQARDICSSSDSGGFGLGLGNVQSLVRLMKGELQIVEKEQEEKGTCFRFNVFLSMSSAGDDQQHKQEQRASLTFRPSFRSEESQVMILIEGEERRKVLKKFLESMHVKTSIVDQSLERIKTKIQTTPSALSQLLISSQSAICSSTDSQNKVFLLVIDVNYYNDLLHDRLREFKTPNGTSWKVVLLHESGDESDRLQATKYDYLAHKPFHGSRVMQVLSLLHGGKGMSPDAATPVVKFRREFCSSSNCWTIELGDNIVNNDLGSKVVVSVNGTDDAGGGREKEKENMLLPLKGKKVLIVDDSELMREMNSRRMSKLGAASVEVCENGKEAFDRVSTALRGPRSKDGIDTLPYDCIFMDGEMPEMDGYEATRMIREEERRYGEGMRMGIVAVTGHSDAEEVSRSLEAGMDFHLTKPLKEKELVDVLTKLDAIIITSKQLS
ncbi:Histidine kinase CKI1 [Linum grandiflorum]